MEIVAIRPVAARRLQPPGQLRQQGEIIGAGCVFMLRKLFFNFIYFRDPPWDTGISPPELINFLETQPPGRALDLGCGTGTNLLTMAQYGWQVTGVDFARRAIQLAKGKLQRGGYHAELYVEDVTRQDKVSGQFDLILDMGCFHSLSPDGRQVYLDNLIKHLAPGGTYLLYVFFKPDPQASGPGVTEAELQAIASRLELVSRLNGTERGMRASAWLTFRACRTNEAN